jgi:hypothetical protein
MYSHPQDDVAGPPEATDAAEPLDSVASAAGGVAHEEPDIAPGAGHPPTPVSSLLAEIARAMQAAAAHERERIDAGVGEEEASQIEKVHARATAESAALRKGADDDVALVESWCVEQLRLIRAEADRRIGDRRSRLEQSITQHGSFIEAEIQSVHGAVQGYRDTLDEFFARMADEGDPSAIARLAGTLPDPPDLDAVRADARSLAMKTLEEESAAEAAASTGEGPTDGHVSIASQQEPVPVMDPDIAADRAGTATGEVPEAAPVAPGWAAGQPSASPGPSEADAMASQAVAVSSQENVAARVIRSLTSWTSPTGGSEDGASDSQP